MTYVANEFGASRGDQGTVARRRSRRRRSRRARRRRVRRPARATDADRRVRDGRMRVRGARRGRTEHPVVLTATQLAATGAAGALGVLIAIVSAEEVPPGSRAYAFSLITMTGALGRGDLRVGAAAGRHRHPGLALDLRRAARSDSALFSSSPADSRRAAGSNASMPMPDSPGHGRRLWLLASAGFLVALFAAPAFQFQNDFLRSRPWLLGGADHRVRPC